MDIFVNIFVNQDMVVSVIDLVNMSLVISKCLAQFGQFAIYVLKIFIF